MGTSQPTVGQVLKSARQMLDLARLGARDFAESPDRRVSGLYNAVNNGRSVTFVLQKLKGRAPGFPDWYSEVQGKLKADPVARWFVELRNRIEKEGTHGSSAAEVTIHGLDQRTQVALTLQAPPNTTATFLGDSLGRSGWEVTLEDGTETEVYFTLPPSIGRVSMHIEDAPVDSPMEKLLPQWLDQLDAIVTEAEQAFGGASR